MNVVCGLCKTVTGFPLGKNIYIGNQRAEFPEHINILNFWVGMPRDLIELETLA